MSGIAPEVSACIVAIGKLEDLSKNTGSVPPAYRKLISEIAVLRLFYLLENAFEGIACRLVSGASYADGLVPSLLIHCASRAQAEHHMKTTGRQRPRQLKWSRVKDIKENLEFVLTPSDHLIRTFDAHGAFIEELRCVRNRIAHNSRNARQNYRPVVKQHYGANLNAISPGTLLLSPRRSPPLVDQYMIKSRILIKALARLP